LNELIERVQSWAEILGPNIYLQAAALALVFILLGKIADIVFSKTIAQFVARSKTKFDDKLVGLLHRPIFVTFVLVGLALATRRLGMSATPEYITLGILRTIAIFIWFGFLSGLFDLILSAVRQGRISGLRSTRILTRDDVEITVPNSLIGNGKIINEAGGPSARHRIRIAVGVAYGSDIDQVIDTLATVADEHDEVCKSPDPKVRFRSFGDYSLDFELLCWINKPVDRGRISHELHCAVYRAFQGAGIEIPFPQRDLHVRTMPAQ
jgi:hypothetical protein